MSLSQHQSAAVNAPRGGLFISAAAGSGKTRVLTARFVRLVDEQRIAQQPRPLDSLIAITFTEKAAGELSQRIRGSLAHEVGVEIARDAETAWVSTIHGLCGRLLKRHAFEAGLDPQFTVCDEVRSGVLKQEAFESALDALSGSERVERLLADYDVGELEAGISSVYEHVRCLGLKTDALEYVETDLTGPLTSAKDDLQSVLAEMLTLSGRGVTEEKNIQQLASLVRALERVDAGDPECGLAVLGALSNFTQNKGCRACAKPLAREAEERAAVLRDAAAGRASDGYAAAFLELLERFSAEYALAKEKAGVLDFEDLQLKARDLLRDRPGLVRHYDSLLSEVMVDEFQDTNELQLSVVSELAGEALATVGDERQSIYGWRNADVEVFRRRQSELGDERTYTLPENFRSHPELVALFNELFAAEPFWPAAGMRLEVGVPDSESDPENEDPWPEGFRRVQLTLLDAGECADIGKATAEAEAVADYFETLRDAGMRQEDFVVLLRAMTRAETFESALRARGFDVYVASGGSFFDTPEAEEVEALLRTFANTRDDEAFARLLCGRMANVSDDALYLLRSAAAGSHGAARRSLWEAAKDPARLALADADEVALGRMVDVITELREDAGRTSLYDLIHRACERLDYDLTLLAAGQPRAWANVLKFARLADEYERLTPGDPSAFLEHLAQRRRHKRYEQQAAIAAEEVDAVRIMSVHAAKGLEFPVVALPELGNQPPHVVPTFDCGSPNDHLTLAVRLPTRRRVHGMPRYGVLCRRPRVAGRTRVGGSQARPVRRVYPCHPGARDVLGRGLAEGDTCRSAHRLDPAGGGHSHRRRCCRDVRGRARHGGRRRCQR